MAAFWIRSASIQIGNQCYSMDSGLYFSFEIPFKDSEELENIVFTVYNLNQTTRNNIKKGEQVILNDGYEGDIGCLFIGVVNEAHSEKKNTEWVTEISATMALKEWLETDINKTYMAGTDAESVGRDLLNIFGVEVGRVELTENVIYPRGKVCRGKVKDVLKRIFVEECGCRMLIRNYQILITDPKTPVNTGVFLSPETGLLEDSGESDATVIVTAADDKKSQEAKDREGEMIHLKCLLNHRIGAGDIVSVQSSKRSGTYQVVGGTHKGSPDGEWFTELDVRIPGA